jgi:phosphatidylglycerophosphatase A
MSSTSVTQRRFLPRLKPVHRRFLTMIAFISPWLIGFFWFRLFDILKPPPAGWLDKNFKHGVGVVLDDFAAGLYAAIALRLTLWAFNLG